MYRLSFNWAWDLAFEIENIYSSESHIEYFLNLEHLWRYFELFWLTSSIPENFSIKLSYLHIFFHRNFHSTNPYTKRCAVKFPIDWCMGLSTEKFTTKSSDHPKIGFWDLASGDAKSQNPNLLRTRTFCSELFSRQTHTPIDWKFHCASFAVWVCRLNISLQRVTAVQIRSSLSIWAGKYGHRRGNFLRPRATTVSIDSRDHNESLGWGVRGKVLRVETAFGGDTPGA